MPYKLPNGQYPYPLNFLASDGGNVSEPFTANDPYVADGSNNWYVLCLTPDELKDLISVIEVGAPIAFPDTYNTITQKYMQMREFPNEIPEGSCMDLCQLILNCINDTPALQQVIGQYSTFSAIEDNTVFSSEAQNTELVDNPVGCDNDIIFGMTTGIVELLNSISTDMFEIIAQNSSVSGRIGDIIEAIPGVGVLPVDDVFQFVESFLEDLAGLYASKYTVQLANELRCELFCVALPTCTLTLEQARIYYHGKLSISLDTTDWLSTVTGFLDNVWTGDDIVFITHYLILDAITRAGSILGFNINNIAPIIQSMFNDPDGDWATLCESCSEWEYTFDFLTSSHVSDGFSQVSWGDGWVSGKGWESEDFVGLSEINYLYLNLPVDSKLTYIASTTACATATNFTNLAGAFLSSATLLNTVPTVIQNIPAEDELINIERIQYNTPASLLSDTIRWTYNPPLVNPNKWYYTSVTIKGIGTDPYA